jgi:hypothetical protein
MKLLHSFVSPIFGGCALSPCIQWWWTILLVVFSSAAMNVCLCISQIRKYILRFALWPPSAQSRSVNKKIECINISINFLRIFLRLKMVVCPKYVADNLNKIVNNYWNRVALDGNPWTWGYWGVFNWTNLSSLIMTLVSTEPLTEIGTSNLARVTRQPVLKADTLNADCDCLGNVIASTPYNRMRL